MTWLTEFGHVTYQAALLKGTGSLIPSGAARDALFGGDPLRLLEAFPEGVRIDDPTAGRVEGSTAIEAYREQSDAWLNVRNAQPRQIASTEGQREWSANSRSI